MSDKTKNSEKKSRWCRIEQNHINSCRNGQRNGGTNSFCKKVMSSAFVNEGQIRRMVTGNTWYLDPNIVMNLRHETIKRPRSYTETASVATNPTAVPDRFQQSTVIENELEKFRHELESQRIQTRVDCSKDFADRRSRFKLKVNDITVRSDEPPDETIFREETVTDSCISSFVHGILDELSQSEATESDEEIAEHTVPEPEMRISVIPRPVTPNAGDCNVGSIEDGLFGMRIDANISVEMDEFENRGEASTPKRVFEVDHQLAIEIKRLDIPKPFGKAHEKASAHQRTCFESSGGLEKTSIIENLFEWRPNADLVLQQKYFLKWVHFSTIEKLSRHHSDQSRIKKMETFLRNIALERKKALTKMKEISKSGASPSTIVAKMKKCDEVNHESTELLARKFNNKLKVQQDIIELQKLKLQRQERVIAELKLSRLLEDADESKSHIKDELKFFARNGCQRSRSKARTLQIAGNVKDEEDDGMYNKLQANGLTAPKFLVEMQARALEREIKHRQAKERREAIEREKEEMRIAADAAKRLEDQEEKRQRIEQLRRKRIEEKQRRIQREIDHLKFVGDMEKAKYFHRFRTQKSVFRKFRDLIRMKKRRLILATEFCNRMRLTKTFVRWRSYVNSLWNERKNRAERHYDIHCMRYGFKMWQNSYLAEVSKRLIAEDWHDLRVTERWFRNWSLYTSQRRLIFEMKKRKAEIHWEWQLKWKVIDHWRRLKIILRIEKETEQRREHWRKKVYDVLPDYVPNRDDS